MDDDIGSEKSLSAHTAPSEPPPLEDADANAALTAEQMRAREAEEQQTRDIQEAAQGALAELHRMGETERLSSQAAPSDGSPGEDLGPSKKGTSEIPNTQGEIPRGSRSITRDTKRAKI